MREWSTTSVIYRSRTTCKDAGPYGIVEGRTLTPKTSRRNRPPRPSALSPLPPLPVSHVGSVYAPQAPHGHFPRKGLNPVRLHPSPRPFWGLGNVRTPARADVCDLYCCYVAAARLLFFDSVPRSAMKCLQIAGKREPTSGLEPLTCSSYE